MKDKITDYIEREKKIFELLNIVTTFHNALEHIDREKYPEINYKIWERLHGDIERICGKLEMLNAILFYNRESK